MHDYLTTLFWFNVGKYGGALIIAGVIWLVNRRWFPHRHDGYVSINGYVHACGRCGQLPAGAVRKGFYGTDPDSPEARRYDELAANGFRAGRRPSGEPSDQPEPNDREMTS